MKHQKTLSRILDGLILLVFILFFSSAGFQDRNTSGWYQQWFPNLNGSTIQDITFLDSLTGFAVTTPDASDIGYILKTSNGGDNWFTVHTYPPPNGNVGFTRIKFATDSIGYASTDYLHFFKTTNAGLNWNNISEPPWGLADMSVVNKDTILSVSSSGFGGGVFRSINGGLNWQYIWNNSPNGNPDHIYMFDKNLGFTQDGSNYMRRTTNGGFNWDLVSGEFYGAIQFFDGNTGWKIYDSLKKTTNGGINWFTQKTPNISYSFSYPLGFSVLNKDTVWMVGARKWQKPPVYKTTNGGLNWGYQYPDTTLQIYKFGFIQFVNSKVGWISPASPTSLMHTTTGGNDTTIITKINSNEKVELLDYQLYQNYPNPFNARTVVSCQLLVVSNLSIKVYDVQGQEVQTLVQGKLNPGVYEYFFNGNNLSSGIYFYSMIIDGKVLDTKRMLMIK
ncbi:MAG: T9SS type A sorting domain-containing protein [Candidatus Kapaibacterium sp.]